MAGNLNNYKPITSNVTISVNKDGTLKSNTQYYIGNLDRSKSILLQDPSIACEYTTGFVKVSDLLYSYNNKTLSLLSIDVSPNNGAGRNTTISLRNSNNKVSTYNITISQDGTTPSTYGDVTIALSYNDNKNITWNSTTSYTPTVAFTLMIDGSETTITTSDLSKIEYTVSDTTKANINKDTGVFNFKSSNTGLTAKTVNVTISVISKYGNVSASKTITITLEAQDVSYTYGYKNLKITEFSYKTIDCEGESNVLPVIHYSYDYITYENGIEKNSETKTDTGATFLFKNFINKPNENSANKLNSTTTGSITIGRKSDNEETLETIVATVQVIATIGSISTVATTANIKQEGHTILEEYSNLSITSFVYNPNPLEYNIGSSGVTSSPSYNYQYTVTKYLSCKNSSLIGTPTTKYNIGGTASYVMVGTTGSINTTNGKYTIKNKENTSETIQTLTTVTLTVTLSNGLNTSTFTLIKQYGKPADNIVTVYDDPIISLSYPNALPTANATSNPEITITLQWTNYNNGIFDSSGNDVVFDTNDCTSKSWEVTANPTYGSVNSVGTVTFNDNTKQIDDRTLNVKLSITRKGKSSNYTATVKLLGDEIISTTRQYSDINITKFIYPDACSKQGSTSTPTLIWSLTYTNVYTWKYATSTTTSSSYNITNKYAASYSYDIPSSEADIWGTLNNTTGEYMFYGEGSLLTQNIDVTITSNGKTKTASSTVTLLPYTTTYGNLVFEEFLYNTIVNDLGDTIAPSTFTAYITRTITHSDNTTYETQVPITYISLFATYTEATGTVAFVSTPSNRNKARVPAWSSGYFREFTVTCTINAYGKTASKTATIRLEAIVSITYADITGTLTYDDAGSLGNEVIYPIISISLETTTTYKSGTKSKFINTDDTTFFKVYEIAQIDNYADVSLINSNLGSIEWTENMDHDEDGTLLYRYATICCNVTGGGKSTKLLADIKLNHGTLKYTNVIDINGSYGYKFYYNPSIYNEYEQDAIPTLKPFGQWFKVTHTNNTVNNDGFNIFIPMNPSNTKFELVSMDSSTYNKYSFTPITPSISNMGVVTLPDYSTHQYAKYVTYNIKCTVTGLNNEKQSATETITLNIIIDKSSTTYNITLDYPHVVPYNESNNNINVGLPLYWNIRGATSPNILFTSSYNITYASNREIYKVNRLHETDGYEIYQNPRWSINTVSFAKIYTSGVHQGAVVFTSNNGSISDRFVYVTLTVTYKFTNESVTLYARAIQSGSTTGNIPNVTYEVSDLILSYNDNAPISINGGTYNPTLTYTYRKTITYNSGTTSVYLGNETTAAGDGLTTVYSAGGINDPSVMSLQTNNGILTALPNNTGSIPIDGRTYVIMVLIKSPDNTVLANTNTLIIQVGTPIYDYANLSLTFNYNTSILINCDGETVSPSQAPVYTYDVSTYTTMGGPSYKYYLTDKITKSDGLTFYITNYSSISTNVNSSDLTDYKIVFLSNPTTSTSQLTIPITIGIKINGNIYTGYTKDFTFKLKAHGTYVIYSDLTITNFSYNRDTLSSNPTGQNLAPDVLTYLYTTTVKLNHTNKYISSNIILENKDTINKKATIKYVSRTLTSINETTGTVLGNTIDINATGSPINHIITVIVTLPLGESTTENVNIRQSSISAIVWKYTNFQQKTFSYNNGNNIPYTGGNYSPTLTYTYIRYTDGGDTELRNQSHAEIDGISILFSVTNTDHSTIINANTGIIIVLETSLQQQHTITYEVTVASNGDSTINNKTGSVTITQNAAPVSVVGYRYELIGGNIIYNGNNRLPSTAGNYFPTLTYTYGKYAQYSDGSESASVDIRDLSKLEDDGLSVVISYTCESNDSNISINANNGKLTTINTISSSSTNIDVYATIGGDLSGTIISYVLLQPRVESSYVYKNVIITEFSYDGDIGVPAAGATYALKKLSYTYTKIITYNNTTTKSVTRNNTNITEDNLTANITYKAYDSAVNEITNITFNNGNVTFPPTTTGYSSIFIKCTVKLTSTAPTTNISTTASIVFSLQAPIVQTYHPVFMIWVNDTTETYKATFVTKSS